METTLQRIIRKTGRKLVECKCNLCKSQCLTCSCLGTPEDIEKIIDAGLGEHIKETEWLAGVIMGTMKSSILMYQAEYKDKTGCVFFVDGLCRLHASGLKPTEGKLSHHSTRADNFNPKRALALLVAKEWINPENQEIIDRIKKKIIHQ